MTKKFADYMLEQTHKYEKTMGGRVNQKNFAAYLGVTQQNVSNWISGTFTPSPKNVLKLARKLGPEVYDALELERPDPIYDFLSTYWEEFDPQFKNQIHDQVQQYLVQKGHKNE